MAPFQLRKQLVGSLILSKLDYCDVVYYALPSKLLKRLQRVQSSAVCFITGKFSREEEVLKLGWLPMMERRDWHLLIATFKALNDQRWPEYASLKRYNPGRSGLRSCHKTFWKLLLSKTLSNFLQLNVLTICHTLLGRRKILEPFVMRPKYYFLNGQKKDWESYKPHF